MKITFIMPVVKQNGGCRVVAIYAEKLLARGHDVTVVSRLPEPKSRARALSDGLRGRSSSEDPNRTAYFDGLGPRHVQVPWKWPVEAEDVPDGDVVVATWWRTAFEVATLPPEKGAKAYFIQHHEIHDNQPWELSAGSYWLPLRKITIADWLVDTMARLYDDPDVVKVENSVDTVQFNAPPRDRNARPRVGLLYSPTRFKGVDISLKAIARAQARFPDLQLVAFGASKPAPPLELPEGSEFHLLPAQDSLRDIYASCDVWLCGSRAEGFHLPPLEAMACRCPVVGTRVGGVVEVVDEGVNGHVVDVEDAEALGDRLIDVLAKSPEEWRAMSEAAYARAHGYSWDDATAAFEAALMQSAEHP